MENISQFYNSLFAIEFTVLSILLAGFFIFLQIIYQDKLYKFLKRVPQKKLIFLTLLCLASLSVSAAGFLISAFPRHDFIPAYNLNSRSIISNAWYGLVALILFLTSSIIAVWLTINEILSLRPSRLIDRITDHIQGLNLRQYLITKYGLPEPHMIHLAIELLGTKTTQLEVDVEKTTAIYENDLKTYKEMTAVTGDDSDPLEPIGQLAIRAIRDRDISLLESTLNALMKVIRKDIFIPDRQNSQWNPNGKLHENMVEHILKWISSLAEECKKEGTSMLLRDIYNRTNDVVMLSISKGYSAAACKVLSYWKLEADKALINDTRTFIDLVSLQRELGVSLFPDQSDSKKLEILDEVFRNTGWLGERLLKKVGCETRPLMHDEVYETPLDALMTSLMDFEEIYRATYPSAYPLIYFDAIWVVFREFINEFLRNSSHLARSRISDYLFNNIYAYSSFAGAAIKVGNGRGACLATVRLCNAYKELMKYSSESALEKVIDDAIGEMTHVAFKAAGQRTESISCDFLSEGIVEHLLNILSEIPTDYDRKIDSHVFNNFIRFDLSTDFTSIKSFIKKLGMARGTNFGLSIKTW